MLEQLFQDPVALKGLVYLDMTHSCSQYKDNRCIQKHIIEIIELQKYKGTSLYTWKCDS